MATGKAKRPPIDSYAARLILAARERPKEVLEAIAKEKAQRRLSEFVRQAWPLIEPATPLLWNWCIEALCDHLQAVTEGRIRKLIVNVPPGSLKSSITSVLWPCWEWARSPHVRWIFASYAERLALRDSVRRRYVLTSEWFQRRWPISLAGDANLKSEFHNAEKGFMVAIGAGGVTGYRGRRLVMDDPNDATQMESQAERESKIAWFDLQWSTRGDLNDYSEVIIQQRTHAEDISGHAIKQGGWELLRIPLEYEPGERCRTSIWQDPRTRAGEAIDSRIWPPEKIAELKMRLGSYGYSGQAQQRPSPKAGAMFALRMFRYFRQDGAFVVLSDAEGKERRFEVAELGFFQTFDTAIKEKDINDWTVCLTCAITPQGDLIIWDAIRDRIEVPDQYEFTVRMREKQGKISYQFVEDKASGQGLIQEGRRRAHPFFDLGERIKERTGANLLSESKIQRAVTVSILYDAGKVFHRAGAPWLADFEGELLDFPRGQWDDQVDAVAYAGLCLKYGPAIATRPKPKPKPPEPAASDWRSKFKGNSQGGPSGDWRSKFSR